MNYQEAKELKEKSLSLVGTETEKGTIVGAILIAPLDEDKRNDFMGKYLFYNDENIAISQYLNDELCVLAIDIEHLVKHGVLFYKELGR